MSVPPTFQDLSVSVEMDKYLETTTAHTGFSPLWAAGQLE